MLEESSTSLSKNSFSFRRFKLVLRNSNISHVELRGSENFRVYCLGTDSFPNTFLLTTRPLNHFRTLYPLSLETSFCRNKVNRSLSCLFIPPIYIPASEILYTQSHKNSSLWNDFRCSGVKSRCRSCIENLVMSNEYTMDNCFTEESGAFPR